MGDWSAIARQAVAVHGALQKPAELAGLLDLADARGVRLVLEIGSDAGGTLWAWSEFGADVLAVSLQGGPFSTGRRLDAHGARVIEGDSHDLRTWLAVREALDGRLVDLLFIDGDHTFDGAARDVMMYAGCVRPGGMVALHDICPHARPDVRVTEVWARLAGMPSAEMVVAPTTWGGIGVVTV